MPKGTLLRRAVRRLPQLLRRPRDRPATASHRRRAHRPGRHRAHHPVRARRRSPLGPRDRPPPRQALHRPHGPRHRSRASRALSRHRNLMALRPLRRLTSELVVLRSRRTSGPGGPSRAHPWHELGPSREALEQSMDFSSGGSEELGEQLVRERSRLRRREELLRVRNDAGCIG